MKNLKTILAIVMMAICTVSSCDMPQLLTESYPDVKGECLEYREKELTMKMEWGKIHKKVKFAYEYEGRQYIEMVNMGTVPLCAFTPGQYYKISLHISRYDTHTKVEVSKPHLVHRFNCRNN